MIAILHATDRAQRCLIALPLALVLVLLACGPASVSFTFDNRTGSALCEYRSRREANSAMCLAEIRPRVEAKWGRDCDGQDGRPISMVIVVKESRKEIYNRTASCGEWDDTDRKFVIEQSGGQFVVTDSLAGPAPSR